MFDRVGLSDADVRQVLAAMRGAPSAPIEPNPLEVAEKRAALQRQLAAGEVAIERFSRAWRALERPTAATTGQPDELRLHRARKLLSEFGTLWRNPAVPDRLREEALRAP